MRSSSIWVPLFIAGAGVAAVTALVVTQRHSRSSTKTEGRASGPASESRADESAAESFRTQALNEYPTLDFDPDPDTTRGLGDPTPPSIGERGEAYDAVSADDLGAEWLARATESLPANRSARASGEFDELTTLDLLEDEPSSLSEFELDPDSKGLIESEAVLADRKAKELEARLESPRPPPAVFDIAELLQDEDAPSEVGRRS